MITNKHKQANSGYSSQAIKIYVDFETQCLYLVSAFFRFNKK